MLRLQRCAALGLLMAAMTVLAATGCLERKETIRVTRDGTVDWQVEYKGDKGDFGPGDALPDRKQGWNVDVQAERDEQGNESDKLELRGAMKIHAGDPMPDSFAGKDEPLHELALQFPTEVTVERKPDGVYFHFKRTYKARAFANIEYTRKKLSDEAKLEELSNKKNEELTDEERSRMLTTLIQIEGAKQIEFLRLAIDALPQRGVKWPQHIGLLARQALIDRYDHVDLTEFSSLLSAAESEERDQEIAGLAGRFNDETHALLARRLQELHLPGHEIEALMDAVHDEETRRAVTEDLGDEKFEITVELPGEVIASNASSIDGKTLKWEFDAQAVMDRDHVLMASSRITHQTAGEPAARTPDAKSNN